MPEDTIVTADAVSYSGVISWKLYRRAHLQHAKNGWWSLLILPAVVLVYALSEGIDSPYLIVSTLASATVFSLAFGAFVLGAQLYGWHRLWATSSHEPVHGTLSSAGFVAESPDGRIEKPWSRFAKVTALDDLLLIYHTPYAFSVLAPDFFTSDQDWRSATRLAVANRSVMTGGETTRTVLIRWVVVLAAGLLMGMLAFGLTQLF